MLLQDDSTKYIQGNILEILSEGGLERIGDAIQILLMHIRMNLAAESHFNLAGKAHSFWLPFRI